VARVGNRHVAWGPERLCPWERPVGKRDSQEGEAFPDGRGRLDGGSSRHDSETSDAQVASINRHQDTTIQGEPKASMTRDTRQTPLRNPLADAGTSSGDWHVLWTRSHSEQLVHDQLADRGFHVFFPTMQTWVRRHGMRYRATVPMFPGYFFLRHRMDPHSYLEICQTRALVKVLGEGWDRLAVIPEQEIDAIRTLHVSRLPAAPHAYLQTGQRVRVIAGLLAGSEGILLRTNPGKGLFVISIHLLQRSVAVEIDCTLVVPA